ncbi:hypothetical protein ASF93_09805 [Microbacterium sp. Leaf347]|uniref:sensor histidine kinase n=1 Tax=unclassified Microbacterium TaxID=2609290 RepID=UPI0006FB4104|nr:MULTISPECIES: ATP-binding protein [unclassified Microbacterium]KQR95906.1 hypothetical protein ASG00_13515 [Microbacterium sp. Leaf351]KQS02757.1 hypothetical protein ASF93_09805 [Microbacterium sp. Leaf347]
MSGIRFDSGPVVLPAPHAIARDGSLTRERVEMVLGRAVALASVVLGAQTIVEAIAAQAVDPFWNTIEILLIFVPLAVAIVSFATGRQKELAGTIFVIAYTIALVLWPVGAYGHGSPATSHAWPYVLGNVATLAAVVALPRRWQVIATVGIPVVYGAMRMVELGFAPAAWLPTALDVAFLVIFGAVLLALAWTFRSTASRIDEHRERAIEASARAAAMAATESERVAVAALMHDSVIAALIAAQRAGTDRERELAVQMARDALNRLANVDVTAGEGSDHPRSASSLADELQRALVEAGSDAAVRRRIAPDTPDVPGRAMRAMVLAGTQAIVNAIAHADGAGLEVTVTGERAPGRVTVTVRDTGPGFSIDEIPDDRLGVRGSIIARVAAFGGETRISSDASGTVVDLIWKATVS